MNIPIVGSAATVDPSENFQVKFFADSASGTSAMTLKGVGNVNCEARVSADGASPRLQFQASTLDLGIDNQTVDPPAALHAAILTFTKQNSVQDIGAIRCSSKAENVNGVIRFYDAWSGTLTFTGSASNATSTPDIVSDQLTVNLAPPNP